MALAAAALPLVAHAQRKPKRVALFSAMSAAGWTDLRDALEGPGVVFDVRSAEGRFGELDKLAAEAVRARPDVIVAHETTAIAAAAKATQRIPVIMAPASQAVAGANITGLVVDSARYAAGVVTLARDLKPNARRIAMIANADDPSSRSLLASLNQAASRIRVPVGIARVRTGDDYEAAFAQWERLRVQVLIAAPSVDARRTAELALRSRLPAISLAGGGFVEAGGLASFAISPRETARKTAIYVERILKGARPSELPVEQIDAFDLSLNLKTAKALELEFPDDVLARANAVVQ